MYKTRNNKTISALNINQRLYCDVVIEMMLICDHGDGVADILD